METKVVCDNIYKIRLKKNYTQEYMAEELGISQSQYSKIERGPQKITFGMIIKIATLLEVDVQKLILKDHVIA